MKVGIPKGLLYYKYHPFLNTFFSELGAEVINSEDTNRETLNQGVKYCVDEACLPMKIFHGHVAYLIDKSDIIVIPRIMQIREDEYICPKFCGLPEMVYNSIGNMPKIITEPIYARSKKSLYNWAKVAGETVTKNKNTIREAFNQGLIQQEQHKTGIKDEGYRLNVALSGHPYNIYDDFINMDLVKKLNKLGVGVLTEEYLDQGKIDDEIKQLYKRPFWTFARNSYGFTSYVATNKIADGIIYISSFACGIDSVVVELIKNKVGDFPLIVLKVDEHTGEAGLETRIEAFVDMLERSK